MGFNVNDNYRCCACPWRIKNSANINGLECLGGTKEMKMLIDGEAHPGRRRGPDPGLVRLIVRAHYLKERLCCTIPAASGSEPSLLARYRIRTDSDIPISVHGEFLIKRPRVSETECCNVTAM